MFVVDTSQKTFTEVPPHALLTVHAEHSWFAHALPEHRQIDWMCETFGDPNAIAIDVGAHIGTWTVSLAKAFGSVLAFEPNPLNYLNLCANLALRRALNVDHVKHCLSDETKT